jgi:alanine racemase
VRLDRLRANALAVQRAVGSQTALVPMVKADAYGLGMGPVVAALCTVPAPAGPWAFGVAAVREGEVLRVHNWAGRVLVFSPLAPGDYAAAAAAGLTPCLSTVDAVARWAEEGRGSERPHAFHIEVDTGMGRAGLPWDRAAEWSAEVIAAAGDAARWEGCYTHFHSADEPDLAPTDLQRERFLRALQALPVQVRRTLVVHSANSAAALRRGGFGDDLARPGIFLYGGGVGAEASPLPVASVRARVVLVRDVPEGSTVGYGATYRARRAERWGTLSIGYGDGIPRALASGEGSVLLRGRRAPIIGRISMDMTTVDLTGIPDSAVGDVATLIGPDGDEEITVDEVARRVGTISYEILTGLTRRLPREYLGL